MIKKVRVIGMDMGDKNHKAIGLSEDGEVVDRAEVPCTPENVRTYLERFPGVLLAIETGTHCPVGEPHGDREPDPGLLTAPAGPRPFPHGHEERISQETFKERTLTEPIFRNSRRPVPVTAI